MPKFSIIVPVYNVEKYITECIESILKQTYKDFELICVDDCSCDNSIKIVENFAKKDARIKIFYQDKNKGVSAARNLALDNANGKYILCVDSDDWINENTLETLLNTFQEHNTESIWFDGYRYFEDKKEFQKIPIYNLKSGCTYITPENIARFPDMCGMKAYTLDSIRKYNLHWPENIKFDEDGHFYFRYYYFHKKTYVINDCLYNYRIREGSTVTNFQTKGTTAQDLLQVIQEIREFYIDNGVYDEYKTLLIKLSENRIKMIEESCLTFENQKMIKNFLDRINFPTDYERLNPNKTPLVTIVVPVYNVEKYIEQCLKSILAQSYKNIEIICVDDCGQDNSIKIANKLKKEDSRIKIIKHRKNKGLGGARTSGLKHAKGEYLLFIDSDDWIEHNCVEKIVSTMNRTGIDTAWFKAKYWFEDLQQEADISFCSYFMNLPEGFININESNLSNFPLVTWNKAYRRDFLLKNNLKWEENTIFEDVEFYYRTFTKTSYIYLIDKFFYHYRQHSNSIMSKNINNPESHKIISKILKQVYKYLNDSNLWSQYSHAFYKYVNETLLMYNFSEEIKLDLLKQIID